MAVHYVLRSTIFNLLQECHVSHCITQKLDFTRSHENKLEESPLRITAVHIRGAHIVNRFYVDVEFRRFLIRRVT